jgi:Fe-Mn family superoxide dismutase
MKRSKFLQNTFAILGTGIALPSFAKLNNKGTSLEETSLENAPFSLPTLSYSYSALEPNIDALTMEIHHSRHHKAYVDNLNKAITGSDMASSSLEELLKNISKAPVSVRNNGGGHWNHSFFWKVIGPANGSKPSQALADQIVKDFGSLDNLKTEFNKVAMGRFGSGWAWLVLKEGKLTIGSTANQDNPLMDVSDLKGKPILALDVWEHAYYLKYQNKRVDYVNAFWNVINWDFVSSQFTN